MDLKKKTHKCTTTVYNKYDEISQLWKISLNVMLRGC